MAWHPLELEFGTRLEKLNLHYMEYLEALDDSTFADLVGDWITANTPYRRGYWLDNWNSYALSIRCVVWMQQLQRRADKLPRALISKMVASLLDQLHFLAKNLELDIGGNHLIKNIKALLWASRFFDSQVSAAWSELGQRLLLREVEEQILDDGWHYERSAAYHSQVFADLLECYHVLTNGAARELLGPRLDAMAQIMVDTTHPDGLVSLFNDGGLHMTYAPAVCSEVYERLRGRLPEAAPVFAHRAAGYFGARNGACLVIADAGAIGPDFLPAHGHGDIFAFEWTLYGHRLIVDAGVYEYNEGVWRTYSRSTRSHNTVTIDNQDQCDFWGAFRVARRARVNIESAQQYDGGFSLTGSHDGYTFLQGAPRHHRTLRITPVRIDVHDEITGGAGQPCVARLLLHPDCEVSIDAAGARLERSGIIVRLGTEVPVTTAEAWWCPDFGVRIATQQLVLAYGGAPVAGEFTLECVTSADQFRAL